MSQGPVALEPALPPVAELPPDPTVPPEDEPPLEPLAPPEPVAPPVVVMPPVPVVPAVPAAPPEAGDPPPPIIPPGAGPPPVPWSVVELPAGPAAHPLRMIAAAMQAHSVSRGSLERIPLTAGDGPRVLSELQASPYSHESAPAHDAVRMLATSVGFPTGLRMSSRSAVRVDLPRPSFSPGRASLMRRRRPRRSSTIFNQPPSPARSPRPRGGAPPRGRRPPTASR